MKKDSLSKSKSKQKYSKPAVKTESLTAVAAVCNGAGGGGRKASTGAPGFCNSGKLKS